MKKATKETIDSWILKGTTSDLQEEIFFLEGLPLWAPNGKILIIDDPAKKYITRQLKRKIY